MVRIWIPLEDYAPMIIPKLRFLFNIYNGHVILVRD